MSVQAIQREETYVDPFTAELFASYDNVGTDLNFDELEAIADDFITIMNSYFTGISIDYEADDYANHYIENNVMDWES
jgi:poly(A) polymerase Pap1|tara:strand:+ start:320 stop:553 length:234 start_codon:yes stop_codon:yes gene_type:complete